MQMRNLLALFGVLLFGAGLVMAISGANDLTVISRTHWAGNIAASDTTEGGNITALNINGTTLTDRWASYYGNVTGTIALTDGTNKVFSWAWTPDSGGEVCLSTASAFNYVGALAATAAGVDTAWGFTSGSDTAAKTFSGTCSNLVFSQATVTSPIKITHIGSSTFTTCGIQTAVGTAKANFGFCTPIQNSTAGKAYNNVASNYEVMVPTADTTPTSTEQYYFYMELN